MTKSWQEKIIEDAASTLDHGDKVLDVGSAVGEFTIFLKESIEEEAGIDIEMTALDIDEKILEENRNRGNANRYIIDDVRDLDLEDDQFDYTIFIGLLPYSFFSGIEDMKDSLYEAARVTKRDGRLAVEEGAEDSINFYDPRSLKRHVQKVYE